MDPDRVTDLGTDHRSRHGAVEGPDLLDETLGDRRQALLDDHLDGDEVTAIRRSTGGQREAFAFAALGSAWVAQVVGKGSGIGFDGGRLAAACCGLAPAGAGIGRRLGADDALHAGVGVAGDRADVPDALGGHLEVELDGLTGGSDDGVTVVELDVVFDRAVVDERARVRASSRHDGRRFDRELGGDDLDGVARRDVGLCAATSGRTVCAAGAGAGADSRRATSVGSVRTARSGGCDDKERGNAHSDNGSDVRVDLLGLAERRCSDRSMN